MAARHPCYDGEQGRHRWEGSWRCGTCTAGSAVAPLLDSVLFASKLCCLQGQPGDDGSLQLGNLRHNTHPAPPCAAPSLLAPDTRRQRRPLRTASRSDPGGSSSESEDEGDGHGSVAPSDWHLRRSKSWDGHLQHTETHDQLPMVGGRQAEGFGNNTACPVEKHEDAQRGERFGTRLAVCMFRAVWSSPPPIRPGHCTPAPSSFSGPPPPPPPRPPPSTAPAPPSGPAAPGPARAAASPDRPGAAADALGPAGPWCGPQCGL